MNLTTFDGKIVLIDEEDYNRLKNLSLNWVHNAVRVRYSNYSIPLSRIILGQKEDLLIDHINRNPLDFRKSNLRHATKQQNACNQSERKTNTSGYKGVSWHKRRQKWQANICVNYKQIYLGLFETIEEAAIAYNQAAKFHHGEFAFINVL